MTFLEPGRSEPLKGGWHGAMGLLAAGACLYNVAAFLQRRQSHLARNAALYALWTGLEVCQVRRHCR